MSDPPARSRPRRYAAVLSAAAAAVAIGAVLSVSTTANAASTLGASAAATGRYFGTAVAAYKLSGSVSFTNASYNGSVAAGASTQFGFQGTGAGPSGTPACTAR